jgi:hypothetical protein
MLKKKIVTLYPHINWTQNQKNCKTLSKLLESCIRDTQIPKPCAVYQKLLNVCSIRTDK